MNISEQSRLVIENGDYFKSPICSGLRYIAAQIALFFCKLFHFLKTGVWITDEFLFDEVKIRLSDIKSNDLEKLIPKEETEELVRIFNEFACRLKCNLIQKDNLYEDYFGISHSNYFIWTDDVVVNNNLLSKASYCADLTLIDGTSIPFHHGDYVVSMQVGEIQTFLPTKLLVHNGDEDIATFLKLRYKNQVLKVRYPKFETVRDIEQIIHDVHCLGSPNGAYDSNYNKFKNRMSHTTEDKQFLMPTLHHEKNATAKPMERSKLQISVEEFFNIEKYIKNRKDYLFKNDKGVFTLESLKEKQPLERYQTKPQAFYNPKEFKILMPGCDRIFISIYEDFIYLLGKAPKQDFEEVIISDTHPNSDSYGMIFDKREFLYKQIDIDNIKYVNGVLHIPAKF